MDYERSAFSDYAIDSSLINGYLLKGGENFIRNDYLYFPSTYTEEKKASMIQKYKEQITSKIKVIDDYFMQKAKRNENKNFVLYRGIESIDFRRKGLDYSYLQSLKTEERRGSDDPVEVLNYVSTSRNINTAYKFKSGSYCCLYELHIEKGIPMISLDLGHNEEEVLLPRNLMFSYVETRTDKTKGDIIVMKVMKKNKNQFNPLVEESKRNKQISKTRQSRKKIKPKKKSKSKKVK